MLSSSKEELVALLKKVKEASISQNLLLNTQFKTKIMVVDKGRERKEDFVLDGEKIEQVESFAYTRIPYQHQRQKCIGNQEAAGEGSGSRTWCLYGRVEV